MAAKWFFDEPHAAAARRLLAPRFELHAPDFLRLELDSLFSRRVRQREITPAMARARRQALLTLPLAWHSALDLRDSAFETSLETNAAVYDCLCLALAARLGGLFVTADRRLARNLIDGEWASRIVWVEDVK